MIIKKLSITKIKPLKYNPRKNLQAGDPEYDNLKKSIKEFSLVEPLIWNEKTGNLVSGHQRLKILKSMGEVEVDCVVVNLDEDKEKVLNLTMNNLHGGFDYVKLKDVLTDLVTTDENLDLTGFDGEAIESITGLENMRVEDKQETKPPEHYDYIVLFYQTSVDFLKASQMLGVKKVNSSTREKTKKIGISRCIDGKILFDL